MYLDYFLKLEKCRYNMKKGQRIPSAIAVPLEKWIIQLINTLPGIYCTGQYMAYDNLK